MFVYYGKGEQSTWSWKTLCMYFLLPKNTWLNKVRNISKFSFALLFLSILCTKQAEAVEYYVAPSPAGSDTHPGTIDQPFLTVQKALDESGDGDSIYLREGTFNETGSLQISRSDLVLKAYRQEVAVITNNEAARLVEIIGANVTIENIVFDGKWRENNIFLVRGSGDRLLMRGLEVKNGKRHLINLTAYHPDSLENVTIENCRIHDALWFEDVDGQVIRATGDAHGVVAGNVTNLTIRNTEIYYVSGDAIQFDRYRWDNMIIENSVLWNGPLPAASAAGAGFVAELTGKNPGENALDTKHLEEWGRPTVTLRNVTAHGWKGDYISNAAAFNLKEHLDILFDGITVYDSEIAFRSRGYSSSGRGNAWITINNGVVYDTERAVRYENGIDFLKIYNSTFGQNINTLFENGGGGGCDWDAHEVQIKNNLYLAAAKPDDSSKTQGPSNYAVNATWFVNIPLHDYHLAADSAAIDAGDNLAAEGVVGDRDGAVRPQGKGFDAGAYEYWSGSKILKNYLTGILSAAKEEKAE